MMEIYDGSQTKIKHQCLKCNYFWYSKPNTILNGGNCKICGRKKRQKTIIEKSFQKYSTYLLKKNIIMLETFFGVDIKIKHQCKVCGHIWTPVPASIKNGTGCPACSVNKSAYQRYKNVPTWVYYIFIPSKNIYKIGLAQKGTKNRYRNEPFKIEIIQEHKFEDGYEAWKLEQKIIKTYKNIKWNPFKEEKFIGWTECFVEPLECFKDFK